MSDPYGGGGYGGGGGFLNTPYSFLPLPGRASPMAYGMGAQPQQRGPAPLGGGSPDVLGPDSINSGDQPAKGPGMDMGGLGSMLAKAIRGGPGPLSVNPMSLVNIPNPLGGAPLQDLTGGMAGVTLPGF
jgi:hypothetical protein